MSKPLRVLQVYNEYRRWGGEDTAVYLQAEMLRKHGHEVEQLLVSTKEIDGASPFRLAAAGLGAVWSFHGYRLMKKTITRFSPDIVHVHNSFPLLSPSIFWAANRAGIPAVQTLHNFRFVCANSVLLRDEKPCEDCVGRFPWPALRHRCYLDSVLATGAVVAMNVFHRFLGTFEDKVHAYVALSEFSREILLRAGLPGDRTHVQPNFVTDFNTPAKARRPQIVFAGAISRPKGVHLLLQAWAKLSPPGYSLILIGDSPDRATLELEFAGIDGIEWYGSQPQEKVIEIVAASRWLVMPSLLYENCPMVLLEAFSVGTPVIVPHHGAFPTFVAHAQDGFLFSPGNADSLASALRTAVESPEETWRGWSESARTKYLRTFTEEKNYQQLVAVYQKARESFSKAEKAARLPVPSSAAAPMARDRVRDSQT